MLKAPMAVDTNDQELGMQPVTLIDACHLGDNHVYCCAWDDSEGLDVFLVVYNDVSGEWMLSSSESVRVEVESNTVKEA